MAEDTNKFIPIITDDTDSVARVDGQLIFDIENNSISVDILNDRYEITKDTPGIEPRIAALESSVSTLNISVNELETDVDTLNETKLNISDIVNRLDVEATNKALSAKQGKVLNDDIIVVKNDLEALEGDVSALNTSVSALNSSVFSLNTSVSNLSGSVTLLNTRVLTLNASVGELNNQVTTIKNDYLRQRDKTELQSLISAKANTSTLQSESNTRANADSVLTTGLNTANGKITTLENSVSTINYNISSLQSRTSIIESNVDLLQTDVSDIQGVIPSAASSSNQLADKNFVNSSISTNTAYFKGTLDATTDLGLTKPATRESVVAKLNSRTFTPAPSNNDYCFVINTETISGTAINTYQRYKYSSTSESVTWSYEYSLNNSSFTANQWAAINSGATTSNISQITTNTNAIATNTTNIATNTTNITTNSTDIAGIKDGTITVGYASSAAYSDSSGTASIADGFLADGGINQALNGKQGILTTGSGISINNNTISTKINYGLKYLDDGSIAVKPADKSISVTEFGTYVPVNTTSLEVNDNGIAVKIADNSLIAYNDGQGTKGLKVNPNLIVKANPTETPTEALSAITVNNTVYSVGSSLTAGAGIDITDDEISIDGIDSATSGQVLTADGSGSASWQSASGGVTSFGGQTGEITLGTGLTISEKQVSANVPSVEYKNAAGTVLGQLKFVKCLQTEYPSSPDENTLYIII